MMKTLLALLMLSLASTASAVTAYRVGPSISTGTGRMTEGIAGTYTLAASSITVSTPTIILAGATGEIVAKGPVVDVRIFGATTTSSDNTVAFAAAITTGKNVYIPAGTWFGNIVVVSSVTIRGAGLGITIIKQVAGNNANVMNGTDVFNATISDLSLDGNMASNPSGDNGVAISGAVNVRFERVSSSSNVLKGFAIDSYCDNVVFDKCEAYSNSQDGWAFASNTISDGRICKNITVSNSYSHNNTLYGLGLVTPSYGYNRTYNAKIINSRFIDNGGYGIEAKGAVAPQIIGNTIEGSGNNGIDLGSLLGDNTTFAVIDAIIIGNHIKNQASGTVGLVMTNSSGAQIIGNDFYDDRSSPPSWTAVSFNFGSTNTLSANNLMRAPVKFSGAPTAAQLVILDNPGFVLDQKVNGLTLPWATISSSATIGGSTLTVATNGSITAPSQPGGRFHRNASQNTTTNVITTTYYDTTLWSRGGIRVLATSSDTVTIPVGMGGVYSIVCGWDWASNATGERYAFVTLNGSVYASAGVVPVTGAVTVATAADILTLAAGDTVKCSSRQQSGGNLTIGGNTDTFLAIQRLW